MSKKYDKDLIEKYLEKINTKAKNIKQNYFFLTELIEKFLNKIKTQNDDLEEIYMLYTCTFENVYYQIRYLNEIYENLIKINAELEKSNYLDTDDSEPKDKFFSNT